MNLLNIKIKHAIIILKKYINVFIKHKMIYIFWDYKSILNKNEITKNFNKKK